MAGPHVRECRTSRWLHWQAVGHRMPQFKSTHVTDNDSEKMTTGTVTARIFVSILAAILLFPVCTTSTTARTSARGSAKGPGPLLVQGTSRASTARGSASGPLIRRLQYVFIKRLQINPQLIVTRPRCEEYKPEVTCDSFGNIISVNCTQSCLRKDESDRRPIPASIRFLTRLQKLVLPSCYLTGRLPSALKSLRKLTYLDLSRNDLSGPLPVMRKLKHLNISYNNFTGLMSATSAPLLESLDASYNGFKGTIPELPSLQLLNVEGNFFSGALVDFVSIMTGLQSLNLRSNLFSGSIPPEIGSLSKLQELRLSGNSLSSSLPLTLTACNSLKIMDVSFNFLSGGITNAISGLTSLQILDLSYNTFSKTVDNLGIMSNVIFLDISNNVFTGSPPSLANLTVMTYLSMANNALSGFLDSLGAESLVYLDVSKNSLSGSIPSLARFSRLASLDMSDNMLTGSLPNMSTLSSLTSMNLAYNMLTSQLTVQPSTLSNLVDMDLSFNSISGSLSTLSLLTSLTRLILKKNTISGPLPSGLGALSRLEKMDISRNSLSGRLPFSLSSMVALQYMQLSYNAISSAMTSSLPSSLVFLDLTDNMISGPLPHFLPPTLELLKLGFNSLTGPIPTSLANLASLSAIDISFNFFTSGLPSVHPQAPLQAALLQSNYFSKLSYAQAATSVCSPSLASNISVSVAQNCLNIANMDVGVSADLCSGQKQRVARDCSDTCAKCPESCYYMGPSAIPTCPCPSPTYAVLKDGAVSCQSINTTINGCITSDNIFLQTFILSGSATTTHAIEFSNFSAPSSASDFALLPTPIPLFADNTCTTSSFSVSFSFTMDPSQASTGGGFTFAVLSDPSGPSSNMPGGLGYSTAGSNSLSVEFDVGKDAWDGDGNHVGINLGGSVASVAAASLPFPVLSRTRTFVWITYDKAYKKLSVFLSREEEKPPAPLLTYVFSLCVLLRPQPLSSASQSFFMGFTAEGKTNPSVSDWCITTDFTDPSYAEHTAVVKYASEQTPNASVHTYGSAVAAPSLIRLTNGRDVGRATWKTDINKGDNYALSTSFSFSVFPLRDISSNGATGSDALTQGFDFIISTWDVSHRNLVVSFETGREGGQVTMWSDIWKVPEDYSYDLSEPANSFKSFTSPMLALNASGVPELVHNTVVYVWVDVGIRAEDSQDVIAVFISSHNSKPAAPLLTWDFFIYDTELGMEHFVTFSTSSSESVTSLHSWCFDGGFQFTTSNCATVDEVPAIFDFSGNPTAPASTLVLTPSHYGGAGASFLPLPLSPDAPPTLSCATLSFSASFSFHISSRNGLDVTNGHGLTFSFLNASSISEHEYQLGKPGPQLGYGETNDNRFSLAVEFDLHKDAWDPDGNHVGIDVGGSVHSIATASLSESLMFGEGHELPRQAKISYNATTEMISIAIAADNTMPSKLILSAYIDLCEVLGQSNNASVPNLFFGFTAANDAENSSVYAMYDWEMKTVAHEPFNTQPDSVSITATNDTASSVKLLGNATLSGANGAPSSLTFGLADCDFINDTGEVGAALVPLSLPKQAPTCTSLSFSTSFSFSLITEARSISGYEYSGHGFTFALLKDNSTGEAGSQLGYGGTGAGLAVEIDCIPDEWDPFYPHVGIDVRGSVVSVAAREWGPLQPPHDVIQVNYVWITFESKTQNLSVYLSISKTKPTKAFLSATVSLCDALEVTSNTPLPQLYAGFTASNELKWQIIETITWDLILVQSSNRQHISDWTIEIVNSQPNANKKIGPSTGLLLSPDSLAVTGSNRFFRYSSVGYGGSPNGYDSWDIANYLSWHDPKFLNTTVWNQGDCGSCWAIAVVDAVASAHAILADASNPPSFDYMQLLKVAADNPDNICGGGNPWNALRHLASSSRSGGGLTAHDSSKYPIVSFERATYFDGWFGLLLAVQRQPVIVHIEATASSFEGYDGSNVYSDPNCYSYSLNHVVLVIGYLIAGKDPEAGGLAPPFWIIRNSWGPRWGDGGLMRMRITGGDGICGINTLPPLYPVVKSTSDPCSLSSWRKNLNPCGKFDCSTDKLNSSTNTCKCEPPFTLVTNTDGSRTCAHNNVCGSLYFNPCKVGSCRNTGGASYTCICPRGFYQGTTADGWSTCAPTAVQSATTMTITAPNLKCSDIYPVHQLTSEEFQTQNPTVNCSQELPVNQTLNVNPPSHFGFCSVFYTTAKDDRCRSIADKFGITMQQLLALNPSLPCPIVPPSTMVCLEESASSAADEVFDCKQWHELQANETCKDLLNLGLKVDSTGVPRPLTMIDLFRYNPGLQCDNPSTSTMSSVPVQVCLKVDDSSFSAGGCGAKCKPLTVTSSTRCPLPNWSKCNKYTCADSLSKNKAKVCTLII